MGRYVKLAICDIDDCITYTKHYQLKYLKEKYNLSSETDNELFTVLDNNYAPYVLFKKDVNENLRKQIIADLHEFDVIKYLLQKESFSLDDLDKTNVYLSIKTKVYNKSTGSMLIDQNPKEIEFISSSSITDYKRKFLLLLVRDLGLSSTEVSFKQLSTFDRVAYVYQKAYDIWSSGNVYEINFIDNHPGVVESVNFIADQNSQLFGRNIRANLVKQ